MQLGSQGQGLEPSGREAEPRGACGDVGVRVQGILVARSHFLSVSSTVVSCEEGGGVVKHWSSFSQLLCEAGTAIATLQRRKWAQG